MGGMDPGMDPALAKALGALRYGLYFLTAGTVEAPEGLLVSWVSQVGGQPPLLLAAVRRNRSVLPRLEREGAFALNLLPANERGLLARLARPSAERFAGLELSAGTLGLPVLARGLGALCCRVREIWRPGDHVLFLGQVEGALWQGGGAGGDESLDAGVTGHAYLGLS